MLYIVSTPIGNLDDVSQRTISTLKKVDLILAEDTRRIKKLMNRYDIKNEITSYHEHTSPKKEEKIISLLKEGKEISLVSDSGTPLISDPGYKLVKKAVHEGIKISPIPGPSAILSALVSSGCTTDKFMFLGFVPKKQGERKKFFEKIKNTDMTTIIYESPYRITKTLEVMKDILPGRDICICREITKKFEEFIYGNSKEILDKMSKKVKGEITIVIDKQISPR